MIICPDCKGEKTIRALVNRGQKGCSMETLSCPRCKGEGNIPDVCAEWVRVGQHLRADRLRRDKSQREEAHELSLDVTVIGRMEMGIIDPASYYVAWEKRKLERKA